MIKVYVHNTEDWIAERDMDDEVTYFMLFTLDNPQGSFAPHVFYKDDWTEIGEL